MPANYKRLIRLYEGREAAQANALLREAFEAGELAATDIDLGKLFAECFGWHEFVACRKDPSHLANDVIKRALLEAEGAVSASSFLNIQGQFMYQNVLDAYQNEETVFMDLIPEAQASTLDGEKLPGVTQMGDEIGVRKEGDPYPLAGVGEDWVFSPTIKDRGVVVPVTWEAQFNDKTGQLIDRCSDVGKWMKIRREKSAIDCVIDEVVNDPSGSWRYNWRGTVISSYGDNSGTHTWDNLSATNGLTDWANIDTAEQNFNGLTDPYTGEPIIEDPVDLIVTKQKFRTAERIVHATEIRVVTPGYATTGNPTQTLVDNPYRGKFQIRTSRLLGSRMATKTDWFLGDIKRYAKCMMAEKMNVLQAPANNEAEFFRRIVSQYRVNERFAYVVVQPRAINKSTVA